MSAALSAAAVAGSPIPPRLLHLLLGVLIGNEEAGIERHNRSSVYSDRLRDGAARIAAFREVQELIGQIERGELLDVRLYPPLPKTTINKG